MLFISMDLQGPYHEIEKGNQYALTVISMLTDYVFIIPMRSKSTEKVIKAYFTGVYSTFGGSKYILIDRGSEFTGQQPTWLAKELGCIKVYTLPYIPTGNSVIEWTHAFLKTSLRKFIYNHNTDWDEIAHIATMAYNVFPHSSAGETPFYLMLGHYTFMPNLFTFYSQNLPSWVMKM